MLRSSSRLLASTTRCLRGSTRLSHTGRRLPASLTALVSAQPSFSFVAPPEPEADWNEQNLMRLNAAAIRLHDNGQLAESQTLFIQLLRGRREHNGKLHPLTIYAQGWISDVCRKQGNLQEATRHAREAAEAARASLGAAHADTLGIMTSLATLLKEQGELAEAEALCREAVRLYARREPEGSRASLLAVSTLSRVLLARGKLEQAEELMREDVRQHDALLGAPSPRRGPMPIGAPRVRRQPMALTARARRAGVAHPDSLVSQGTLAKASCLPPLPDLPAARMRPEAASPLGPPSRASRALSPSR